VLHETTQGRPDLVPEAAPPRFVLLEDGQFFVGGTSRVAAGRLDSRELKELDRRLSEVRKLPAFVGAVSFGQGPQRFRLFLKKGRPIDAALSGDPAQAPLALQPLAALVTDLLRFVHPSLRPFAPTTYSMTTRETALRGGCRPWRHKEPVTGAIFAPRAVPASDFPNWPTGATPASVCVDDKRYAVALRPLLPGER
jgi:hypothetical protein